MCACGLKPQHFSGEFIHIQSPSVSSLEFLADLVILAKDTAQVTACKENRSRSFGTRNGRLLPEVQADMRNQNLRADFADRKFPLEAVYAAIARAANTIIQLTCKRFTHNVFCSYINAKVLILSNKEVKPEMQFFLKMDEIVRELIYQHREHTCGCGSMQEVSTAKQ